MKRLTELEEERMDEQPDQPAADAEVDQQTDDRAAELSDDAASLLQELVAYLRDSRTELREEWARRISEAELLSVMSDEEIFSEATEVYDNYVDALETGSIETLQTYARELSERIIPRGVETHEVLGIVLLLRDVLARSLFAKYQDDLELLNRILDAYEPAANRIAVTVGVSFVEERERVIHDSKRRCESCPRRSSSCATACSSCRSSACSTPRAPASSPSSCWRRFGTTEPLSW
jgi:rsbT co-antagonist protein RsbR